MFGFVAEGACHAAAAGIDFADGVVGWQGEGAFAGLGADEGFLVAVTVQQELPFLLSEVEIKLPFFGELADEFLEYFDGYSIGSNDMTQLSLGLDRDSELIAHLFDERNPAVKKLLSMVDLPPLVRNCRGAFHKRLRVILMFLA